MLIAAPQLTPRRFLSRREFAGHIAGLGAAALAARASAAALDSTVRGVRLGLITGSLNPLPADRDPIDAIVAECVELGAANVELVNLLEPRLVGAVAFHPPSPMTAEFEKSRAAVREWRLNTPLALFRGIRKKFDDAGLNLISYVSTFDVDWTADEIDAVFRQMQALGVGFFCTNQSRVDIAPRLIPYAEKYRIRPAWHTHANNDPNEVGTPESLEKLLAMSDLFAINLDLGHFTAGNHDAADFLATHHDRITHIHIKDRKRDNGPNVALGTGDTPIGKCLSLIRDNRWPIFAIVEREFRGPDSPVAETRGQLSYLRKLLES